LHSVFVTTDGQSFHPGNHRLKGFLLDENLPHQLRLTLALSVVHSTDLGKSPSDTDVWNYAEQNDLVIVTKDADFSDRIAVSQPPPWVIHLRFGNVRKKDFHAFLRKHWERIYALLPAHKLINVYIDRIEALA
jgi:predicted nuclease of predicted toxin-antitoxin system